MPSYIRVFDILARRAVAQGGVDVESFIEQALLSGMTEDALTESLLHDLDNDGPLFGKFFRSLTGASGGATMAAIRQGETMGAIAADKSVLDTLRFRGVDGSVIDHAIANADPEMSATIEASVADFFEETWIAELRNTCNRCLPLHGVTRTREEWVSDGLSPETIHAGWDSACHCRLVPVKLAEGRKDLMAPLVRQKVPKGKGASKRGVLAADVDRALKARETAIDSMEGRRMMRILGQANKEAGDPNDG